jgi:hypothetical protein
MLLIRVERLDAQGNLRELKPLWLAWVGEEMPPVEQVWRLYLRRFTIDHWYRFLKQRLHWTVPKLSTPKQCERWSDLMPLMTWELWLARDIVTDNPLPWQKSLDKWSCLKKVWDRWQCHSKSKDVRSTLLAVPL